MDLILRNLRLRAGETTLLTDIGIAGGRIAAVEPGLAAQAPEAPEIPETPEIEELDLGGRFVVPGFVESHIHLDKACILERCTAEEGTLREAIGEVAKAKRAFTVADIRACDRNPGALHPLRARPACAAIWRSTR